MALTLTLTLTLALTLTRRAVQFLQREGARSLADVAKYGLAEALLPVEKTVPQRRCHSSLSPYYPPTIPRPVAVGHAFEVCGWLRRHSTELL